MQEEFVKVTPHIFRLNLLWKFNWIDQVPVATWLVNDNDGKWYLIDCGVEPQAPQLKAALRKFFDKETDKAALEEVAGFAATHFHDDHCGALQDLWEASDKQLRIYAHSMEIPFLQDGRRLKDISSKSWTFNAFKRLFNSKPHHLPTLSIDQILNPYSRDASYVGGGSTSSDIVISAEPSSSSSSSSNNNSTQQPSSQRSCSFLFCHCPGHTPGHCAFLHTQDHALLCGDAFASFSKNDTLDPTILPPDPVMAIKSMRDLAAIDDFELLLPSHHWGMGIPRAQVRDFVEKKYPDRPNQQ